MQWEIGIDMGTGSVRMAQRENGVLAAHSAELAYFAHEKQPFAWGDEARALVGRTPAAVRMRRPMKGSVLEDRQAVNFWLHHFTQQASEAHRNRRGTMLMSYTAGSRAAQEEALMRAALEVGVLEVGIVRSDVAGAIGAGLDVLAPGASFVLELGAGHITASIITLGRIAAEGSLPYGMDRINEQFVRRLVADRGFTVGELTAEDIKLGMGSAENVEHSAGVRMTVQGFDLRTRTPRSEVIKPADICSVITPVISEVIFMLEGMIAQIPEELAADLIDSGITVIGGGARMPKLAETLGEALQIPCFIADEPENAVVRGLAEILRRSNHFDALVTDRMARADRNR